MKPGKYFYDFLKIIKYNIWSLHEFDLYDFLMHLQIQTHFRHGYYKYIVIRNVSDTDSIIENYLKTHHLILFVLEQQEINRPILNSIQLKYNA